jgi:hypothetical protein
LIESPLVRTFDYGGSKGYWTGNHIIQQVDDVTDCLKTTLGSGFEYYYMFDHSSGHAKKCENGLDVKKMNVSWGGQSVVRNSIIEKKEGYVGQYYDPQIEGMIKIGCEQTLTYTSETDLKLGPFHLNKKGREAMRFDSYVELSLDKQQMK